VASLSVVEELVSSTIKCIDDESLIFTLNSFCNSVRYNSIQFQLGVLSHMWGVRIEGYRSIKFVGFIKDLAFMSFPFLYNYKDALLLSAPVG